MAKKPAAGFGLRSFRYAFRGIAHMLRTQRSAWVHAGATVLVIGVGLRLCLTASEWSLLVLAIIAVWIAEALNTAIELLADAVLPEFHPLIEKSKDVAAGAVLISALGSIAIGIVILGPHVAPQIWASG